MSNKVDYIYCSSCGYEAFDVLAAFSGTTAGNGDKCEDDGKFGTVFIEEL